MRKQFIPPQFTRNLETKFLVKSKNKIGVEKTLLYIFRNLTQKNIISYLNKHKKYSNTNV